MLIARLMDWHKAWAPPKEFVHLFSQRQNTDCSFDPTSLGPIVYKGFDFTFRTCLFSILPPSFASGFKALASWALSPEDFPPADPLTARTPITIVWQHCETLGILGRFESIISSVGYERIERHVLETCEGNWSSPMLQELRKWTSNKVLSWLLEIYVRGQATSKFMRFYVRSLALQRLTLSSHRSGEHARRHWVPVRLSPYEDALRASVRLTRQYSLSQA